MAAPPHYGPLRLWRGRATSPKPPGTGAFDVTPSTSTNADWTPSPLAAGSVQSDNTPAQTAGVKANQSSGRSTKHPGLGSSPLSSRSPHVASTTHVSALAPCARHGWPQRHRPNLRADPAGPHAGKYQSSLVEGSLDSTHFTHVRSQCAESGECGCGGSRVRAEVCKRVMQAAKPQAEITTCAIM